MIIAAAGPVPVGLRQACAGLLSLIVLLAASLFVPAWTLAYWQAWVLLTVFSASSLAITIFLAVEDPKLLARRIRSGASAETQRQQQIIQVLAALAFIALFVVPALDHRFGWSMMSRYGVAAGNTLVALGFFIIFLVFRANTFASAVIEVNADQTVIRTGPYAVVRHPMYIGALILLAGIPLALGSWWGLVLMIPMTGVIVWRLLSEEAFLASNLPDYATYRDEVHYRLVPFIW